MPKSQPLFSHWLPTSLGKSLTNLRLSFSAYEMELTALFPFEGCVWGGSQSTRTRSWLGMAGSGE